ncbi:MAG: hypothetical protein NT154_38875 [Verrucomicrobia bacterium]|nr:hypothetical protein [Verrucomicrobiota bacterium]
MNIFRASLGVRALLCASLGVFLAVILAITAAFRATPAPPRVTVLDARFRVLSAKVLRGTNDSFYLGNPTEGRLRDILRKRFHLNVKPIANLAVLARVFNLNPPRERVTSFALRFTLKSSPSTMPELDAELQDASGGVVPAGADYIGGTNPYWCLFNLDRSRTNAGNYKLRLTQGGVRLAEVAIYALPPVVPKPFRMGPNAF